MSFIFNRHDSIKRLIREVLKHLDRHLFMFCSRLNFNNFYGKKKTKKTDIKRRKNRNRKNMKYFLVRLLNCFFLFFFFHQGFEIGQRAVRPKWTYQDC